MSNTPINVEVESDFSFKWEDVIEKGFEFNITLPVGSKVATVTVFNVNHQYPGYIICLNYNTLNQRPILINKNSTPSRLRKNIDLYRPKFSKRLNKIHRNIEKTVDKSANNQMCVYTFIKLNKQSNFDQSVAFKNISKRSEELIKTFDYELLHERIKDHNYEPEMVDKIKKLMEGISNISMVKYTRHKNEFLKYIEEYKYKDGEKYTIRTRDNNKKNIDDHTIFHMYLIGNLNFSTVNFITMNQIMENYKILDDYRDKTAVTPTTLNFLYWTSTIEKKREFVETIGHHSGHLKVMVQYEF